MVSISAPFPLFWLSFQFKKQERGHSALFQALQAISWLFIHQEPQSSDRGDQWNQSPSSFFPLNLGLRASLIRGVKTLSKCSESQPSIERAPFKGAASLYIARDFFDSEGAALAPESSTEHLSYIASWKGAFQLPLILQDQGCCRRTAKGQ